MGFPKGLEYVIFQMEMGTAILGAKFLNLTNPFNISFRNDGCCGAELYSLNVFFFSKSKTEYFQNILSTAPMMHF